MARRKRMESDPLYREGLRRGLSPEMARIYARAKPIAEETGEPIRIVMQRLIEESKPKRRGRPRTKKLEERPAGLEGYSPILREDQLKRWASRVPVGIFIKTYLELHGRAYVGEMYRELKKEAAYWRTGGRKLPSYQSFRTYINVLKHLGLIEPAGTEPSESGREYLQPRQYYRLTEQGKKPSEIWADPFKHVRLHSPTS